MRTTIFLDMDGVTANFVKGVCDVTGCSYEKVWREWPKGQYDIKGPLGIAGTDAELFAIIEQKETFWEDLEEFPWSADLYASLSQMGRVYFCSSPTWDANSIAGKHRWLQARFGKDFKDFVYTSHKYLLARPDTILVDDFEDHVNDFVDDTGRARGLLFPSKMNWCPFEGDPVRYVI